MEFEIEIEITGNFTNGLIRETQGRTEEVRRKTNLDALVAKELIVGIEEEVNVRGEQVSKPGEDEVKDKLRDLLEFGSGIIVIGFHHSTLNPSNERFVKKLIESDYPRHYLGAVPVL